MLQVGFVAFKTTSAWLFTQQARHRKQRTTSSEKLLQLKGRDVGELWGLPERSNHERSTPVTAHVAGSTVRFMIDETDRRLSCVRCGGRFVGAYPPTPYFRYSAGSVCNPWLAMNRQRPKSISVA